MIERSAANEKDMLQFWRNMAMLLNEEVIKRGDRIAELEASCQSLADALTTSHEPWSVEDEGEAGNDE